MRQIFALQFVLALAAVIAACGSSASPTSLPAVAPSSAPVGGLPAAAVAACSKTTYAGCLQSMATAVSVFHGQLVAVCEYDNGTGDVVLLDAESDAQARCSGGGTIIPSRVVAILRLP